MWSHYSSARLPRSRRESHQKWNTVSRKAGTLVIFPQTRKKGSVDDRCLLCKRQMFALQTSPVFLHRGSKYLIFRTVEISPGAGRCEEVGRRKGIMVAVGRVLQEQGGYEVVGHVTGCPTTFFRKLSDKIRGSRSQHRFCFCPLLFVIFPEEIWLFFVHPLLSFRGVFLDFSTLKNYMSIGVMKD